MRILYVHQLLLVHSGGSISSLFTIFRMKINSKPLIINLIKLHNGYQIYSPPKQNNKTSSSKNPKNQNQKNPISRVSNRLARQLSIPPQVPEPEQQSSSSQTPPLEDEGAHPLHDQENDYQIERENKLPQKPCTWFKFEEIHQLERQSLPQFFDGKTYKSPQLYRKLRNFIVKVYDECPKQYLTKIACRRILRGDANCIMRVHQFLEREGVINFGVSLEGLRTFQSSFMNKTLEMHHLPQTSISQVPSSQPQKSTNIQTDNLTFSVVNKPFSRTFRVYCSLCKLITGLIWYQPKNLQSPICFACFQSITPKENYDKVDIIEKINNNKEGAKRSTWSIEDNIKLLELMSSSSQSWQNIINQFEGKKSLEDIALQFMQFPITNLDISNQPQIHQSLIYPHHQYVEIINKLYQQSEYVSGNPQQHIKLKKPPEETNTSKLINLLLQKFTKKIDILKQLEDVITAANESMKTKMLRQKIHYRTQDNIKIQKKEQQGQGYRDQPSHQNSLFHQSESQQSSHQILRIREDDSCGGLLNLNSDSAHSL